MGVAGRAGAVRTVGECRRVGERKTELRGLLNLLRLFVFAEVTSDIAERRVGRKRLGVHGLLRFLRCRRSRLILPCLYLRAIFGRENLRPLQVLVGVHVLGFFLLTFLPRAFLACSLGDILSGASCRAKNEAGGYQNDVRCRDPFVALQTDDG